jgi:glycosyltransferase 2 family protein
VEALGVLQSLAGCVALVTCSAVALSASRVRALAPRDAVTGALACAAANVVTPAGIGGSVLAARLHQRTGLTGEEAVAAVGLRALASGVAGVLVGTLTALLVGDHPSLPGSWVALLALVGVAAVAAVLLRCPHRRSRAELALRRTATAFLAVLRSPVRALVLLLAAAGVTAGQLVVLDGAVDAVGGALSTASLLVALVGSSAARAAVPSPGGIGPVEAALVAGLTALGLPAGSALVAVGLHRVIALGLPVLAGVLSLAVLKRRSLV